MPNFFLAVSPYKVGLLLLFRSRRSWEELARTFGVVDSLSVDLQVGSILI